MHPVILARISAKAALKAAIGLAGLPFRPSDAARGALRVLYYHRVNDHPRDALAPVSQEISVTPRSFFRQMEYLRRHGYAVLSAETVEDRLITRRPFPGKAVLLTFDDGYADNFTHAAVLLKAFGFPALFFLTTDYIGGGGCFPWERQARPELHRPLSWEEVRRMGLDGMSFGSHTRSHPRLDRMSREEMSKELEESKARIERETGRPVTFLAYPAGGVSPEVLAASRKAGYRAAFTTVAGPNAPGCDPFLLRRIEVSASDPLPVFALKLMGALDVLRVKEAPAVRRICDRLSAALIR